MNDPISMTDQLMTDPLALELIVKHPAETIAVVLLLMLANAIGKSRR